MNFVARMAATTTPRQSIILGVRHNKGEKTVVKFKMYKVLILASSDPLYCRSPPAETR